MSRVVRQVVSALLRRHRTTLHVLVAYIIGAVVAANPGLPLVVLAALIAGWAVTSVLLGALARWWNHREARRLLGRAQYESVKEYLS